MSELRWGTYGENGDQEIVYKPLSELDSDHLRNILLTQDQITLPWILEIVRILQERLVEWTDCLLNEDLRAARKQRDLESYLQAERDETRVIPS